METQKAKIDEIFSLQQQKRFSEELLSVKERKRKLRSLLNYIVQHSDEIAAAVNSDFNKPVEEVHLTEIIPVTMELRQVIRKINRWSKVKRVSPPLVFLGSQNKIIPKPKGSVLIISPWNYPFLLAVSPLISAIAAGNTVIIKPSERTPKTSAYLNKMASELFEKDNVAVIEGGVETSKSLLALPFDHIFFTGGSEVGKIVMKAAAENLTSVTLELGGKSPVIIDSDADIKLVAKRIAWGKLINAGQTCISPDYIVVHKSKMNAFITGIKEQAVRLFPEESGKISGVVDDKHLEKLNTLLEDAVNKGAKAEYLINERKWLTPVLLYDVKPDSRINKEEIFGAILPVFSFEKEEEIFSLIKRNPNPLTLYYFGKNKRLMKRIERELNFGSMVINDTLLHFANHKLPFGGVRQSGLGKAHGYYGFMEFSNLTPVFKQRKYSIIGLLYPPYNGVKEFLIKFTERYL